MPAAEPDEEMGSMTSSSRHNSELLTSVEGLCERPKLVLAQGP
jgi:hypothetical protein